MKRGSKIGVVCCSDGLGPSGRNVLAMLGGTLKQMGLVPVFSDYIYAKEGPYCGSRQERADALMDFYCDDSIEAVFDVSGGDLANGILPYLDYRIIGENPKPLWGYSDLTAVINAIYAQTGNPSILYQIRNLVYDCSNRQAADFRDSVLDGGDRLFSFRTDFVQGTELKGIVVGGNIRCMLKLVGTHYWPDMKDKVLFLESRSGGEARIEAYLCQLEQNGVFQQIKGILLGTFTELEQAPHCRTVQELVCQFAGMLPVAKTQDIGHGTDSKALAIGRDIRLYADMG